MISLLNPIWLIIAVPIFAVIVTLYLRKGRNIQKIVSSLYFIKQLSSYTPSSRRSFFLPLRAILELLLILLLLLMLSGLSLNDRSEKLTIVIDNSLSMLARVNPQDISSETILDAAKREAASNLDFFSSVSKISVWSTSPKAQNLTAGYADSVTALNKINSILPTYAGSNIEQALSTLNGKALVFTDLQSSNKIADPQINLVDFGIKKEDRENVAIENLKIDALAKKIVASVKSYVLSALSCSVKLSQLDSAGNWKELSNQKINLSTDTEVFADIPNLTAEAYKAEIVSCNRPAGNSLNADDIAWLTPEKGQHSINLITAFDPKSLNLQELSSFNFRILSTKQWEESPDLTSPAIFHRYLPKNMPATDSVFIYPQNSESWLLSEQSETAVKLIDWDRSNPVLRYLNFPSVSLQKARIFNSMPGWAHSFLKSSAGDIAVTGSRDSKNYIAVGFELFPFAGKDNLPISILTLNMLNYLSNSQNSTAALSFSFQQSVEDYKTIESAIPAVSFNLSESKKQLTASVPGLYNLKITDKKRYQAGQLFLESESNLLNPENLIINSSQTKEDSTSQSLNLESWLIAAILLITTLDLLFMLFRRGKNV